MGTIAEIIATETALAGTTLTGAALVEVPLAGTANAKNTGGNA
jgi:hypothetical protein